MPPIIDPKPSAPPEKQTTTVEITSPEYLGTVTDTRYTPQTSLLTHIEGASWIVNYFSQVLNNDSAIAGQNVNRDPVYQQYKLIKNLQFRVSSPLTTSQDEVSKNMIITGAANIYPFLIPNIGDMFEGDIGDGRSGIFKVTSSEKKSIFKETAYAIEYQLIDYATLERRADLMSKVIETLYFKDDFLTYGQNPLVEEEEYHIIEELQSRYHDVADWYLKSFLSNEYKTIILPGQETPVYDHFLVTALKAIFTTDDSPEIRYIRKLNCDGNYTMKAPSLWNVLLTRDRVLMKNIFREVGLISALNFEQNPMMEGIYHSGIQYVVYPKDAEVCVDYQIIPNDTPLVDVQITDTPSPIHRLSDLIDVNRFQGLTKPDTYPIHPVKTDDYYILSQKFYDKMLQGQSALELAVWDYIEGKSISNKLLLEFSKIYHSWGGLERLYYVPIILILIKYNLRSY